MKRAILLSLMALTISACTKKSATSAADEKVLNLAIWGDYISEDTKNEFTKKTGITVNMSNYFSNEELLAKVQSGAGGIDVAVPSDYMVAIMTKMNFLEKLDKTKIPNVKDVETRFLAQSFDPENNYSVPYAWATAGFAYNTDLLKKDLKSWKDVLASPDLNGKISLMDDMREVLGMALKAEGHSVNSKDPKELKSAVELLKKLKLRVKMFRSDTVDLLLNKEVALSHAFSSSAIKAMVKSGGKIKYVLPEEGDTKSIDNLVILKGAKHLEAAHAFINFLLTKEANAAFVIAIYGNPVVKGTREILPKDLRDNEALFPKENRLTKFEFIQDLGETTKQYDEAWTQVKTAD